MKQNISPHRAIHRTKVKNKKSKKKKIHGQTDKKKTAFFRNLKDYLFNPVNGSILLFVT